MFVVFCVFCIPDIIASIVWRGLMSAWALCGQAVAIWLRLGYIPGLLGCDAMLVLRLGGVGPGSGPSWVGVEDWLHSFFPQSGTERGRG